ncbi:unnamed protein product [Zymoseptoria tritici ST99CH_3D1]|nr:unnamed protein product [Zymoseptoria tritici ST99CH_3D1]
MRKFGLVGNRMGQATRNEQKVPTSDTNATSHLSAVGTGPANTFNQPLESNSGTDFTATALRDVSHDMESMVGDDALFHTRTSSPDNSDT